MSRHKSAFLRRNAADTFNQANDLVSHGLIFNRRQRSTNAQIEPVGHHFLHLNSGLADMAFVLKVADAFIQGVCNNGQADGADLVDPLLILLHLLERYANAVANSAWLILTRIRRPLIFSPKALSPALAVRGLTGLGFIPVLAAIFCISFVQVTRVSVEGIHSCCLRGAYKSVGAPLNIS
jgi:hypothetical protein